MNEPQERDVGAFVQVDWDDLVIQYGRTAGRVCRGGKAFYLSASLKDGTYVSVPRGTFERLVREGRLNQDGTVRAEVAA